MSKINRGSNIVAVGAYNERLVLSILRTKGALSKVELTKETGLSKQTLSDVISRLDDHGLILRGEPIRGRIGQPQVPFVLNPQGAYSLGFKIGRKSYELVLMDFAGQVIKLVRKNIDYPTPASMIAFASTSVAALRSEFPPLIKKCTGMGVAMPNELWRWGAEFDAPEEKIESWRDFDVQGALERGTQISVAITNDVAAACNGELLFGKGETGNDFLYVYIGTFIGGGIVLDGKILQGSRNNAGAIGSMLVAGAGERDGRQLLSVASIINLVHDLMKKERDVSSIWNSESDWTEIHDIVKPWAKQVARYLAMACINVTAVTDVSRVIIDGSLPPTIRDMIVKNTAESVEKYTKTGLSTFKVQAGTLGYSARVIGAASIPTQERFSHNLETLLKAEPAKRSKSSRTKKA